MIKQIYQLQDLPLEDLQRIGLVRNGKISLAEDELKALLSGRRTDMLRLENLQTESLLIPALDAKLSVRPKENGALELLVHPIYRAIDVPDFLTENEARGLGDGEIANVTKFITDDAGNTKEVIVEFDSQTNEFLFTDTAAILAPEEINGIPLTPEQKDRYRKGKEVQTDDGTTIQYAANEKQGIRSDRLALIASVLIDGGVTYMLFKGLNALFNKPQETELGKNYNHAFNKVKKEVPGFAHSQHSGEDQDNEQAESIGR